LGPIIAKLFKLIAFLVVGTTVLALAVFGAGIRVLTLCEAQ
jgi:hypothetical protein